MMTNMKKTIICIALMLMTICHVAFASKAVTRRIDVTLTDGSKRTVVLMGDEHYSFYASTLGELIIREGNTWRLATEEEKTQATSSIRQVRARRANESIATDRPFPHVGTPKALVIMVEFSDRKFTFGKEDIDRMFNSTDYDDTSGYHNYSSLAQYMEDCSFGQYRPQFDIVGPYTLSNSVAYYGSNSGGKDRNFAEMITEACTMADPDVDFTDYDSDNDGYVDLVYIVYAGYGENWGGSSDYLWPKSGVRMLGEYDGVKVYRYGFNQELAGYEAFHDSEGKPYLNGIGVLAHEFCHTLGLCDIYPTASWTDVTSYDNQSMEMWDLMDNGENNYNGFAPTPLTAWQRELFGWMQTETLSDPTDVTLSPIQTGGKACKIVNDNDDSGNEYYILESIPNGNGTGWYKRMRGNGMLVTHVNYNASAFYNFTSPNNTAGSPRMTILPADGILKSSYRMKLNDDDPLYITYKDYYADMAGDTYPGTSAVKSITDYKAYTGIMDKPITDIEQTGWEVSFKFMGGAPVDAIDKVESADAQSSAPYYNLAGQRVNKNYKGIIINNGKKILQ